jgi:hypothetical protein
MVALTAMSHYLSVNWTNSIQTRSDFASFDFASFDFASFDFASFDFASFDFASFDFATLRSGRTGAQVE